MKRKIRDQWYNTDTAYYKGGNGSITLYRKRNGVFFLYDSDNDTITPLELDDAKAWGAEHLSSADYDNTFNAEALATPVPKRAFTTLSLEPETLDKMDAVAKKKGISRSQLMRELASFAVEHPDEI